MPERIQSMSSTMMRIVECCLEAFIALLLRTNAARSVMPFIRDGVFRSVLCRTCLAGLHIRGLLPAYGQRPVAFAGHCLERLPVIDAQTPARVGDRSRGLHVRGHDANAGAAHTEVLSDS